WAVEEADLAMICPRAEPILALATAFLEGGRDTVEGRDWAKGFPGCTSEWLENGDIEEVVTASESMRKKVRGDEIGRLG
ncbi:MAG: hypothetical protein KAJ35_08500, partial [Thermoplasmata archaeon]|nr:hypothetical protein [Thermoplasmata archaeon]